MDLTHLHLALNHVPVVGVIFGFLIFIFGLIKNSDDAKKISLYLFILSAIVVIPVYLTGETAEELIEDIPGVLESVIEEHEDFAKISMALIELLGLSSLIGVYFDFKKKSLPRWFIASILVMSLLTGSAMAKTANLGGKIRHTELQKNFNQQNVEQNKEKSNEKEQNKNDNDNDNDD